jgi:hypothetical protein
MKKFIDSKIVLLMINPFIGNLQIHLKGLSQEIDLVFSVFYLIAVTHAVLRTADV